MTAASSNSEHLGHPLLPATNAGSPLLFSVPGDGPPFSPSSSRKPRNVFSILLPLSSHPSFQQDLTGMVRPCRSLSSASVPSFPLLWALTSEPCNVCIWGSLVARTRALEQDSPGLSPGFTNFELRKCGLFLEFLCTSVSPFIKWV